MLTYTGKSRRDIPFYQGGELYDLREDPLEEHPIEPGSNAEADAARKPSHPLQPRISG